MRILAVDTTTARESIALVEDGALRGEVRLEARDGHSRRLLPAIAFLLESLGLAPTDVQAYAVTTGPGSFTGLRVGLSTVQGLALATGAPCLGVSALDVLAQRMAGTAPRLVPMIDAYRNQVFAAIHDSGGRREAGPFVEAPLSLLARVRGKAAFLGDGATRYREEIQSAQPEAMFPERSLALAGTLARMAEGLFAAGKAGPPRELRPLYLREADIRKTGP